MSNGFQQPISIKEAMDNIYQRKYLLPAIQREFVWKHSQIELLFDSILRDYPINSFMTWKITNPQLKRDYKFYEFIKTYREWFNTENPQISTDGVPDFEAIIDGQQRLTSLYIGLHGSYAYKSPRKWWKNNEENIPTRYLFLNLTKKISSDIDNTKEYDFKFQKNHRESFVDDKGNFWFRMKDIMNIDTFEKVLNYQRDNGLDNNSFAMATLGKLFGKVHIDKLINLYMHEDNDPDKILEIFLRTNSGGTPLSFSDLLMSISSANWKKLDAREELNNLVNEINTLGNPGFRISRDFILKTCLVLFSDDIRFQLKNFSINMVETFENNWEEVRKSIISAFELFASIGFNDKNFRAKNAAIPVIYYIYYNGLSGEIVKSTYSDDEKKKILKWLTLSFVRSIFGGQTDQILKRIRTVMENENSKEFPFDKLVNSFSKDPNKNYNMDNEFIEDLLTLEYGTTECDYILYLLYPDKVNDDLHRDHMHPKSFFENEDKVLGVKNIVSKKYASDAKYWNSILNLQLLDSTQNTHKQDSTLSSWADEQQISNESLLVDNLVSLDIENFSEFIESRKKKIRRILKRIL